MIVFLVETAGTPAPDSRVRVKGGSPVVCCRTPYVNRGIRRQGLDGGSGTRVGKQLPWQAHLPGPR